LWSTKPLCGTAPCVQAWSQTIIICLDSRAGSKMGSVDELGRGILSVSWALTTASANGFDDCTSARRLARLPSLESHKVTLIGLAQMCWVR